jgi:hypothetical protein
MWVARKKQIPCGNDKQEKQQQQQILRLRDCKKRNRSAQDDNLFSSYSAGGPFMREAPSAHGWGARLSVPAEEAHSEYPRTPTHRAKSRSMNGPPGVCGATCKKADSLRE